MTHKGPPFSIFSLSPFLSIVINISICAWHQGPSNVQTVHTEEACLTAQAWNSKKNGKNEFLILPLSLRPRLLPPVVTAWEGGRWHKHGMTEHSWWWKGTVRTSGPTTEMTHTHTWLCVAHTRQTHLPVICVTHSLTHTARPPVLATTQPQGWIHRDKKERKMEKYKGEGRSDTRPAVRMRRILETSKRKRMMQYNKVRADGCEELKRFSQISSFTHPCVVSKPVWVSFFCGIQKEDFENFYLSPPPPMQLQWKGTEVSKSFRKNAKAIVLNMLIS